MNFDLHSHTSASDGKLSPTELVVAAQQAGVDTLAITDHDDIAGYLNWSKNKPENAINVIPGIEFSTTWNGLGVHVLGLNIDVLSDAITDGVKQQLMAREARSIQIIERLRKTGLDISHDELIKSAGTRTLGRPHIARYLVQKQLVKDEYAAFKKYLGAGKLGDVKNLWAELSDVIDWIRDGHGTAILAHPNKYKLTFAKLERLTKDFVSLGGQGLEVISGRQDSETTIRLAKLCTEYNLLASRGSDFHDHGQPWAQLGKIAELPILCKPVWDHW